MRLDQLFENTSAIYDVRRVVADVMKMAVYRISVNLEHGYVGKGAGWVLACNVPHEHDSGFFSRMVSRILSRELSRRFKWHDIRSVDLVPFTTLSDTHTDALYIHFSVSDDSITEVVKSVARTAQPNTVEDIFETIRRRIETAMRLGPFDVGVNTLPNYNDRLLRVTLQYDDDDELVFNTNMIKRLLKNLLEKYFYESTVGDARRTHFSTVNTLGTPRKVVLHIPFTFRFLKQADENA